MFLHLSDLTPWFSPSCSGESGCLHFARSPAEFSCHCGHISVLHSLPLDNVTLQKHFYSHNSSCSKYIFNKAFLMIFCCYKIKYDAMLRMPTSVTVFSPAPSTF